MGMTFIRLSSEHHSHGTHLGVFLASRMASAGWSLDGQGTFE